MRDVKKDIQKQLAAKERSINRNLAAAEVRFGAAAGEAQHSGMARSALGKETPAPAYNKDELARMSAIASRNRDAHLLGYVYGLVRDKLLENPTEEALSRAKGRSVMARIEMLKQAERSKAAAQFVDFRQLPLKDRQGLDNTKSINEVSPKNALETLIRHFTDGAERKREGRELPDIASQQLRRAEELSIKARDYSVVVDRILEDHCRAAGVSSKEVAPTLSAEEITQVRDFSERLSAFSGIRKEFSDAARLAEERLQEKETSEIMRNISGSPADHERTSSRSLSPSQSVGDSQRTDRDSSARGR